MALFMQNQNEFRNSLVNMGFSDLQMNFSDHKESQKEHNQKEKNSSSFEDFEDEKNDSIDITMPYYV
jgi:DNA-binding MurR/RpiR family transcriptional regulator